MLRQFLQFVKQLKRKKYKSCFTFAVDFTVSRLDDTPVLTLRGEKSKSVFADLTEQVFRLTCFVFFYQLFKTLPNAQQIQEVEFFCFELNQQNKSMFNFARFCIVGLSSRVFDLLNSLIYDLKGFVDLR